MTVMNPDNMKPIQYKIPRTPSGSGAGLGLGPTWPAGHHGEATDDIAI